MSKLLLTTFVTSLVFFAGCRSTVEKHDTPTTSRTENSDLSWTEALARKARVQDVQYKVFVKLTDSPQDTMFNGKTEIRFKLHDASKALRLDFFEGKVNSLVVNGKTLDSTHKRPYWINLPAEALKENDNIVLIDYTQNYSQQGQGLHKFVDPQTNQVFLYTQFETFDANRFMPAFDQPDLRAILQLTVEAPANWEVVSTTNGQAGKKTSHGYRTWVFPPSEPIATYLFSLIAGPYKVYHDQFEDIPLRLFVRPSMAKYLRSKEWFTYTKQGLKFFNSYFGLPYPFKKYDQLVVPEFNAGAMENVGAVTFNERFLWRSQPTRQDLRGLAGVILHEMAHMWFGDIVTMKWWNDLWLNESFATFMASLALNEATEYKEAWQEFFSNNKRWAYWEDSLPTSHSIEAPVKSVKDAFANFDGITYGKGASALKQLRAYMTPEAFQKGIQSYIKTYAFQNAELKDYISSLQGQTNRDLSLWADRWLRQSGTDKISTRWKCKDSSLDEIEILVTPSAGTRFRPQTLRIGLFQDKNGRLQESQSLRLDLNQEKEVIKGPWPCPAFVYPNYQDDGYAAVSLDPQSLEYAQANLSRIPDGLLRAMIWHDLWNMVRNTELPLRDYIAIVKAHFTKESDPIVLDQVSNSISGRRGEQSTVIQYWPDTDDTSRKERDLFISQLELDFLKRFKAAKAGSDEQKLWFDNYVALARTPQALDQLAKWASSTKIATRMPLDVDRHWMLIKRLARFNHPKAEKLLADLKRKDSSDRGHREALSAEASRPDLNAKEKWVTSLKQPKPQVSFAEARSVLRSLFPIEQKNLKIHFAADFYEYLKKNGNSENEVFVQNFASALAPLSCDAEETSRLKSFLNSDVPLSPTVNKTLRMSLDEDERCQRIRAMSRL